MKSSFAVKLLVTSLLTLMLSLSAFGQADVARKTTAVTYPLDDTVTVQFAGTTRFPRMKGNATVKRTTRYGTRIELSVEKMPRPFELGAGYATYVLWAISPTGQAQNLGEFKRSGTSFIDSKITVTTALQTFSMIITAEPHFMVTRPSQTIMMENLYPVGRNGKQIGSAPAISYFGNSSDFFRDPRTPEIAETDYAKTPSAILQAKQAVALAKFAGAERDAPAELTEAVTLLQNAVNAFDAGRDSDTIDIAARKSISASVKAESLAYTRKEAREKRNEQSRSAADIRAAENKYDKAQDEITDLKAELAREIRNRELSERDAMNFSGQIKDLRDENGRLREELGKMKVEADAAKARLQAAEDDKQTIATQAARDAKIAAVRAAEPGFILALKSFGPVAKSDRGLVLTLPENLWSGIRSSTLMPQSIGKLTSLGEILANNPAYRITIESYTDANGDPGTLQSVTDIRASAVEVKFTSMGVRESQITAKGYGATVPVAANNTNANRAKNRRLQVVLSLDPQ